MDRGLPTPRALVTSLTELLDRDITLTPAPAFIPGPFRPATLGVYVDDSLQVVAVAVLDMALSAYTSASLVLLPPARWPGRPEFVLHKTWVLERRLDVRVTVPGYGSGLLALVRS